MRLKLKGVLDRNVPNKERILIYVQFPADLSYYVVLETRAQDANTIFAGHHSAYWFDPKKVNVGDQVILYTGYGEDKSVRRNDGRMNHFFYWGLKQTIFADSSPRVVLFELQGWESSG